MYAYIVICHAIIATPVIPKESCKCVNDAAGDSDGAELDVILGFGIGIALIILLIASIIVIMVVRRFWLRKGYVVSNGEVGR